MPRMRVTVQSTGDRAGELQTAIVVRQQLWERAPVQVDPDHPLYGTHRDEAGHAYFEFATSSPEKVRQVIEQFQSTARVELTESPASPGPECVHCGNVAGPVQPAICPNCGFQDISSCPICKQPIPRELYARIAGDLFRCPHCKNPVRLRFNSPMVLADGDYNQPLVMVDEAAAVP